MLEKRLTPQVLKFKQIEAFKEYQPHLIPKPLLQMVKHRLLYCLLTVVSDLFSNVFLMKTSFTKAT